MGNSRNSSSVRSQVPLPTSSPLISLFEESRIWPIWNVCPLLECAVRPSFGPTRSTPFSAPLPGIRPIGSLNNPVAVFPFRCESLFWICIANPYHATRCCVALRHLKDLRGPIWIPSAPGSRRPSVMLSPSLVIVLPTPPCVTVPNVGREAQFQTEGCLLPSRERRDGSSSYLAAPIWHLPRALKTVTCRQTPSIPTTVLQVLLSLVRWFGYAPPFRTHDSFPSILPSRFLFSGSNGQAALQLSQSP